MKKLISIIILSLLIIPTAFAATLGSQQTNTFEMNQTRDLYPITITAAADGEITSAKGIGIFMDPEAQMLWDNVKTLTLSGTAVTNGRVSATATPVYKNGYKTLYIPVLSDFKSGESLTILGATLRAYHTSFSERYLQLDINGDGISDARDVNKIEVQITYQTDFTAPYPPTDFSATLSSDLKQIAVKWTNSPDFDLNGCSMDRTRIRSGANANRQFSGR